ncbi:MAG: metallophosphoesterase family protein [Aestuariibaculum sp.]
MATYAIGDIHGGLKALVQVLNRLEIKDNDTLIFMGDYVDGWSESAQVIQFLIELSEKIDCIFIKGNHDAWCEDWLKTGVVNPIWYMHGGKETIESYEIFTEKQKKDHLIFFGNLQWYYLDNNNRLFIHAGFTSMHGVKREVNKETFYYDRTLWEMALALDKNMDKNETFYPKRFTHYNEIFIGHTPTINFNYDKPMYAANVWNVDTGVAFFGKLTGLNIDTKTYEQSDPIRELYPNEKGRNKR